MISRVNWREKFERHSKLGIEFGMPKQASYGSTARFSSDFEHPDFLSLVPDPRALLPPTMSPPPDYDVFGGEGGFTRFGREKAKSRFGLGTVIPSTYRPPQPVVPTQPPLTPLDAIDSFSGEPVEPAPKKSGLVKTLLAGIGLFTVGVFLDAAIESRLGPHHKPIVLFHK